MTDDLITWLKARLDDDGRVVEVTDWADVYRDPVAAKRRFLAEIDAKRRIIEAHSRTPHYCPLPVVAGQYGQLWTEGEGACYTLRLLALPHADREGYRDEWRL